jgi:hypothetical protein
VTLLSLLRLVAAALIHAVQRNNCHLCGSVVSVSNVVSAMRTLCSIKASTTC